jgi:UDP-N-acetylglucosamine--N-acetylmuramyl-(pentapeptide) pyrophosphoryl-undecaprenol N-acetylglucosamine transferase
VSRIAHRSGSAPVIVLTGGGSGGHVVPVLSVAAELKRRRPGARIIYVGQRGDQFASIAHGNQDIDETYSVFAGKFRRYHGEGFKQLLDIPTMLRNARDLFLVVIGILQSRRLIGRLEPDVVFSRGGYVSVPVCLGAALRRVPYITHDSDPVPSLANRIIARWAALHAVAMPKDVYPYPQSKTVTTGIPLSRDFMPVTLALKKRYRKEIGIPEDDKLLFVIGGGLGSQRVNRAVADVVPHLLRDFSGLRVVHAAGRAHEEAVRQSYISSLPIEEQGRVQVVGFIPDVYLYSGAADVVVSRAGATNLAEFAVQGKACVVIPSAFLAGGHQLANARYLEEKGAAVVIDEDDLAADPNRLAKQVARLMKNPSRAEALGAKLAGFARPDAAEAIAGLILEQAGGSKA